MAEPNSEEKVIVVVGDTGMGKSSFINSVIGSEVAAVDDTLFTCTREVKGHKYKRDGLEVTLVDTPGFRYFVEGDDKSDEKIVKMIDEFLKQQAGKRASGIFFLHSIAGNAPEISDKAMRTLKRLCGNSLSKYAAVVVTTRWDEVGDEPDSDWESPEAALTNKDGLLKELNDIGVPFYRTAHSKDLDLEHLGKELLSPATIVELFLTRRQESSDSEDKDPKAEDTLSKPEPAFTQQDSTQPVACPEADPEERDIISFEERPSPGVPERNLDADHEVPPPALTPPIVQPTVVPSSFGENVDRLGAIRSILDNYPFSAGLLREILQNSDDAEATEQTFLLDCRRHPSERIYHPSLANTQGPALLASNNAKFAPEDWTALQNISRSSKREDTSKIGKFGIGIRSCYHVTDYLQILSGGVLVIFDPQSSFSEGGGARFSVTPETVEPICDHLQSFGHFLPLNWNGEAFNGTVVRMPLRTEPGEIGKIVSPETIQQLFKEFIQRELSIAMLFLQHLRSIEFAIIDEGGRVTKMAHCTVKIAGPLSEGVYKQTVCVQRAEEASAKDEEWLVVHRSFVKDEVLQLLSTRAGPPCESVLKKHKLRADVGLAFPLSHPQNIEPDIGQLFTFLRLPIKTRFPAHIHSLFSLTSSRQNLRPHGENGIVKGFDDYTLIEWNKLLFDVFIPRAWTHLLRTLPKHAPTTPHFSAWPVTQHFTESDSAYWGSFPENVLDTVLEEEDATIWPVTGQDVCKRLQDVLLARPSTSDEVIKALADTGMSICRPPDHLFRMMEALPGWNHRILTPERASTELRNIVGLPIIPTVSVPRSFVSLAHRGTTSDIHTLLESSDVKVFRLCDGNAISLGDLPPSAVDLFRQEAPRTLNVKPLDPDQVVRYLALHPTRRDLSMKLSKTEADGAAVTLLTSFWVWFDSWGSRSSLLPKLEDEYVLPCAGGLRRAIRSQPVFDAAGIPALSACLSGFGVPFLSNALGSGARNVLAKYGFLKSTTDMHVLLDAMGTFAGSVSNQNVQLLFSHFNQYMVNSTTDSFSKKQKTAFRRLPIFPIVEYDPDTSVRCRRAAVNGLVVYGVRSFELLPELPNTVFVDVNVLDPRLLPPLNEAQPGPMSDMEVVGLSIKSLDSQPKTLLAHMLQHVASDQQYLTPGLEESLRSEKYAYSSLGTREAPQTLIDPSSPLYSLYANDGQRLHSLQDEEERSIADSLARLGLLDKALSENNIMDRILHISSTVSLNDAVKLMNIIYQYGFNCCTLTLDKSVKWLPTQKESLATAAECRPAGGTSSEELHLFDKVLELVHPSAMVSPSLRTVLGWDDPIPVDVLLRQFRDVLDNPEADVYHRVKNLIKELSRRRQSLTAAQWSSLRELLENRRWVPTSEYTLVESWQAVFSSPFQGIYMLAPDLSRMGSDSQNFLTNLGCLPIPSFATVARRFSQLTDESPSATVTSSAIATLKFAVSLTLSEDERSQLLVPDDLHRLQHIQDVLFNDVGPNSLLLPPNEVCLANSSIDDTLARALELKRLGLEHVHLQKIGEDMGITLATIVQKTLAQYTDKQFLLEFLANAQDAGASKFMVILNDYISVEGNFLSLDLAKLHDSPSVMVYNDSEFSESDFEGICKTHIGSKVDNPDSIGQFGLGALTMFHITECAVIYSGHKVLFLDPSKSYLPIAGRASLLMPLKDLNRLYPGHTNYLRGLDFFEPQECRVNGTIFFLPLRSSSSTPQSKKPLFSTDYSINTFQQAILRDFHDKADECLLFIQVKDIEAQLRTSAQSNSPEPFWSFNASREETAFDGITVTKISINSCATSGEKTSSKWLTMSTAFQASDVPQECRAGVGSKTAKVGLAAPLGEEPRAQSKFFSMLPLATSTALPVHVNASFRLSADRRQIRLDSYDNDTLFNRWLLEMQLPPLYLALLERIAQEHDNTRWWPGAREDVSPPADRGEDDIVTTHEHVPTAIILESFYSKHLPKSSRSIFYSMYSGESLRQSDVILYPTYSQTSIASPAPIPSSVQRVIDILEPKNVTKPTAPVSTRLEKVGLPEVLGPNFIRKLLLTNGGAELIQKELSKEDLVALLAWLVGEGKRTDYLEGLPLLLLQNESWGVFETKGQTFYSSPESPLFVEEDFLPSDLFVHPATMPKKLSEILLTSALSISRLDGVVLQRLVKERLDGLESQARAPWVDRFWKVYPKFPKDGLPKSIERLSLIPTMSGTFKTLIDCRDSGFLNDDSDSERLVEFFQDLGIDVIPVKRFPSELQVVLQSREYDLRGTLFSRFLRCVSPIIESAVKKFLEWPSPRQDEFAGWVREAIRTNVDAKYVQVARKLPVWPARRGLKNCLCSANEVTLLPRDISVDAGRFSRDFMTANGGVANLALNLPRFLQGEDETIYKDLLTSFVGLTSTRAIPTIKVPNASRTMVACGTLFDRTPFFIAAFGSSSDRFLLQSFQTLSPKLRSWGLKQAIDFELFALCARAFQDDVRPDQEKLDRARIIYRTYCETLPLCVSSNKKGWWNTLDDIRFIPRDMQVSRQSESQPLPLPASIRDLPLLVSPSQVVQARFHTISWTQRVVAQEEPLERLLVAFPEFGTPSVKEVVAHLGELCRLPHGSTVLHDLKATYQWLTKNSPAVVSFADQLKDEPIFLNVNNPEIDEWIWSSASQMAFEVSDLTNIQGVRDFLKPYDRFLKAAGVVETYYPKLDEDNEHSGDSYDLKLFRSLRANLNEQRLGGNFTDVLFLPQKEASGLTREKLYLLDHPSLRGHRGYLASCTPWFKKVFLEASQKGVGWSEDGIVYLADDGGTAVDIEEDTTKEEGGESIEDTTAESLTTTNDFPNMQIVLLPKSRNAIMAVLDYFYTDQPFPREETSLEDLLQTLELSHYLDVKALFVLSQREMVRRKLVNAETLEEVQRRSQHLDAGIINKWCNDYKEANSKLFGLISRQTVRQFFNGLLAIRG